MIALLVLSLWVQQPIARDTVSKDAEKIRSLSKKLISAGQQGQKANFAAVIDTANKKFKEQPRAYQRKGNLL